MVEVFLAFNHGIVCFEGSLDQDFTGPVKVLLFNHTDIPFQVVPGMHIAQIVNHPFIMFIVPVVQNVDNLQETTRKGGFGRTGKGIE